MVRFRLGLGRHAARLQGWYRWKRRGHRVGKRLHKHALLGHENKTLRVGGPRCEALRVLIEERHVQPREGLPWRELLEHDGVLRLRVLRLHVVHQAAAVDGKVALEGVGRNRDIGALVRQAEEKQLGRVRAEEGRLADRVHLQLLLLDLRQRRRARIQPEPILPDVDEAQAVVARLHVGLDQRDVRLIRAQHEAGNTSNRH
mmetsp:Transcript_1552/g.6773  ORF Transcript_1552/g.6773 Transcript_1552/m.6773 type:complete len:201 (+) Transcript_1552:563-1165(+)